MVRKPEGPEIEHRLKKAGWSVTRQGTSWTATHNDAPGTTLSWGKNARIQRVLDEAAAALGQAVRTTSGTKIKQRRTKVRELNMTREDALRASRIALASLQRRPSSVPSLNLGLLKPTLHALRRAKEHGITGEAVYDALLKPVRVIPSNHHHHSTWIFFGEDCKVVVDRNGAIITVIPND